MTNYEYDSINIRAFQELRTFARDREAVAFARMVTRALGCLISDDPASHRHRWAVERVQGVLLQLKAGWPATDAAKIDIIRTTSTAPSELIDAESAEELGAFAYGHGEIPFYHLVVAAMPSEHGPGEDWAIERVNDALDAIASAGERRLPVPTHDFTLAVIKATNPNRPDGTIARGELEV